MDIKPALLLFPAPSRKDRSPSPEVVYPTASYASLDSAFSRIFDLLRSGEVPEAPHVVLYSASGAHDLGDVLAAMWSSPEGQWLLSLEKSDRLSMVNRDRRMETFRSLQPLWTQAINQAMEKDSSIDAL